MGEKRVIDKERIELDYRAGILSLREMAERHTVSVAYIRKMADAGGWERDLNAKIQAKADALVHKAECTESAQQSEKCTIEANAQAIADVKLRHRKGAKRGLEQCDRLLTFLEGLAIEEENVRDFAASLKQLADTQKALVSLEREAWNIANSHEPPPAPSDVDPIEGARRIAFVLTRGAKAAEKQATVH